MLPAHHKWRVPRRDQHETHRMATSSDAGGHCHRSKYLRFAQEERRNPWLIRLAPRLKNQLPRFSKNIVGRRRGHARGKKYGFKPTPEMNSFGHLVIHIVQSNNVLCSKISGAPASRIQTCRHRRQRQNWSPASKPRLNFAPPRSPTWTIRN